LHTLEFSAIRRGEIDMANLHLDGGTLHYRVRGDGAPVVALHGSASTGAQWRSLVGYLEGRYRIFTPDLPGYGASTAPATGGLAGDAAAIAALIDRIGAPAHLVGHSYGAAVALKLAALRPDAVRSLTVIEPVAFHLLLDGDAADRALFTEAAGLAARTLTGVLGRDRVAAMRGFIDYWNGDGAWARTSPGLRRFFLACAERVAADFRAVLFEPSGREALARIECPTLAVMGLDSAPTSMRVTEIVAETLPRAVLRLVPDAGHLAPLTDPHLVDPMVARHLVAVDRSARRLRVAA
jgi:lipase